MSFGISNLLRDWYPFLEDGPVTNRAVALAMLPSGPYLWTHTGPETGRYSNKTEVRMTLLAAGLLVQTGVLATEIAILTPYKQQVLALMAGLKTYDLTDHLSGTHIGTVDSFQGEERRVIIVSLVRSNPRGRLGFLSDDNRKGVLLSRAKVALYLIGNRETLRSADNWAGTLRQLEGAGRVHDTLLVWCRVHPTGTSLSTTHRVHESGVDAHLLSLCKEALPCLCCSLGPRALPAPTMPPPLSPNRPPKVATTERTGATDPTDDTSGTRRQADGPRVCIGKLPESPSYCISPCDLISL